MMLKDTILLLIIASILLAITMYCIHIYQLLKWEKDLDLPVDSLLIRKGKK